MKRQNNTYKSCSIPRVLSISSMVTAFRQKYDSSYTYEGECHDFWEFICVLQGSVSVAVEDKVFEVNSGQILFLNPLEFHNMCSISNTNPEVLIMSFRLTRSFHFDKRIVTIGSKIENELINLLDDGSQIFDFSGICTNSVKENSEISAQIFINRLEILLLKMLQDDKTVQSSIENRSTIYYSKIIGILKINIKRRLSIKDIAVLANMSESNVKKVFSMYANKGVIQYFNELKIIEAKKLLKTGLSVYEVSKELGYTEQNYFSNAFKKATGYSPKNWLKELANAEL